MNTSIIKQNFVDLIQSTDIAIPKHESIDVFAQLTLSGTNTITVQLKSGSVAISDNLTNGSIAVLDSVSLTCTSLVLHNTGDTTARINLTHTG